MEKALQNNTLRIIIAATAVFLAIAAVAISKEFYYILALPFLLAVGALLIFRLDWALGFVLLATPLAIDIDFEDFNLGLSIPTEPVLAAVLLLMGFRLLQQGTIDSRVARHPMSVVILLSLAWMLMTTITSSQPLVSIKFVIARLWFVVPMYFVMIQVLRKKNWGMNFYWLYLIPLAAVCIYTVVVHHEYDFTRKSAHWVMWPFYKDHTVYGAVLGLFYPITVGALFLPNRKLLYRIGAFTIFTIMTVALILSYTRAAWLSVLVAGGVFVILYFKIKLRYLVLLALAVALAIYANWGSIVQEFEKNKTTSSEDLTEHVQSVSNISTDDSNTERLNRWNSALRMFADKPWFGFGPGTYMFEYARYQSPYEKTTISTNAGDLGNAHSEYLGPLSEQGVLGLLLVLAWVVIIMVTGVRTYFAETDPENRILILGALLGLVTYFFHGFLNNFLDSDKLAVPVFAFCAFLVAARIKQRQAPA